MPQPIEQQYKSRLALESRLSIKVWKKYNLIKLKCPPKLSVRMLQRHSFYKCEALSNPIWLFHLHTAVHCQQSCVCCSSRHTLLVRTWYWEATPIHYVRKLVTATGFEKYNHWTALVSCKKLRTATEFWCKKGSKNYSLLFYHLITYP